MKKTFLSIVTLVSLSLFISCGDDGGNKEKEDDTTKPTITLPGSDTLILDLGDKAAALSGVKANDDVDGNITSSIQISNTFETIGYEKIEYVVYDAAQNKGTAERDAIVRSGKLAGTYTLAITPEDGSNPFNYAITVSEKDITALLANGFHQVAANPNGWDNVIFIENGPNQLKIEEKTVLYDGDDYILTGDATYDKNNNVYQLVSITYTLTRKVGSASETYSATCTK